MMMMVTVIMMWFRQYLMSVVFLWVLLLPRSRHTCGAATSEDMVRLRHDLLSDYSRGVVPKHNQSQALHVNMAFFLIMIHDLDMKNQVLTASGWLKIDWVDEFLVWEPAEYGGIEELIVFQREVWLPDLLVENTAQNYRTIGNDAMLISVTHDGKIIWEPGIVTETSCAVNIGKYPFDTQVCEIRYLTWMHTNRTLTVGPEMESINLDAQLPNGEWDIITTEARHYSYPSTYRLGWEHTGTTFVVQLRRKRTFYILNTIIPVVMLSLLNVLVFILPADCGERMALAVTVLLSFTVYLGIISDNMPKTSESLSLLAVYLTTLLSISTLSVCCAGLVLNIHHRDPSHPIPHSLLWLFTRPSPLSPFPWARGPSVLGSRTPSTCSNNRRWGSGSTGHDVLESGPLIRGHTHHLNCQSHPGVNRTPGLTSTPTDHLNCFTDLMSCSTDHHVSSSATDHVHGRSSHVTTGSADHVTSSVIDQVNGRSGHVGSFTDHASSTVDQFNSRSSAVDHQVNCYLEYAENSTKDDANPSNYSQFPAPTRGKFRDFKENDSPEGGRKRGWRVGGSGEREGGAGYGRKRFRRERQRRVKEGGCAALNATNLTWHEIGKSLDSILFWIFFIITNTITTIILVMFVGL